MTTAHPSNYTKGRSAPIEFLVLHYTAGRNDSAAAGLKYFESPRGASAHYFVDRNGWLQSVSDEDTAWSVGTAGVYTQKHLRCRNGNSISIEMCCRYDAGRYWLEDAVVANAGVGLSTPADWSNLTACPSFSVADGWRSSRSPSDKPLFNT